MSEIEWDIPRYRQHSGLSTRSIFGSEFNLVSAFYATGHKFHL